MAEHQVIIVQDLGNVLMRAYHWLKPEEFDHCRVVVKNLRTQATFDYDKYHDVFPSGDYALLVLNEKGRQVTTKELHLDEENDDGVCLIIENHPSMGFGNLVVADQEKINAMFQKNRLISPAGYNGY